MLAKQLKRIVKSSKSNTDDHSGEEEEVLAGVIDIMASRTKKSRNKIEQLNVIIQAALASGFFILAMI